MKKLIIIPFLFFYFFASAQFQVSIKQIHGLSRFQNDHYIGYDPPRNQPPPYEFIDAFGLGPVISFQPARKNIYFDYGFILNGSGSAMPIERYDPGSQDHYFVLETCRNYYLNMPISLHLKLIKSIWFQLNFSNNIKLYEKHYLVRYPNENIFADYEASAGIGVAYHFDKWIIGLEAQRGFTNLWHKNEIMYYYTINSAYQQSVWLNVTYKLWSF